MCRRGEDKNHAGIFVHMIAIHQAVFAACRVSAISARDAVRRVPSGPTISMCGPCAHALKAVVIIESATIIPIAEIAEAIAATGLYENLARKGVTAANLTNHDGRRSPYRLGRDIFQLTARGLRKEHKDYDRREHPEHRQIANRDPVRTRHAIEDAFEK